FLLPADLPAEALRELQRACVAGGPDNMPWPTEVQVSPTQLAVRRDVDDSGGLVVPWEFDSVGRLMGSTATLIERPTPYQLLTDLAGGKVNQLRCQAWEWRAGGLPLPAALDEEIRRASQGFGRALIEADAGRANQEAHTTLALSYQAAQQLVQLYMDQVF